MFVLFVLFALLVVFVAFGMFVPDQFIDCLLRLLTFACRLHATRLLVVENHSFGILSLSSS
jgi:uncharacterized membrane protein YqaE (UPF0057 family)